ncbi:BglG family transcription antiterminator [Globicatella sanguinis]
MSVSSNAEKIINYLLEKGDFISANEIAIKLKFSTKTIYRGINEIREVIGENIIESYKGRGYRLNFEEYKENLNAIYSKNLSINTPEYRRMMILLQLLSITPEKTSIKKLSMKYFVSESSITNDLDYIEANLIGTKLSIKSDTQGTAIVGTESEIRAFLMKLLNNSIFNSTLNIINNDNISLIASGFSESNIKKVSNILSSIFDKYYYNVENPYYTNLLTHLLILIKRFDKVIYQNNFKDTPYSSVIDIELDIAKEIITEIEKEFEIQIHTNEIMYVYTFLVSSRKVRNESLKTDNSLIGMKSSNYTKKIVDELILSMEKNMAFPFTTDINLRQSLILHIQPLLNRLEYEIIIVNPIINQIKKEYKDTFSSLKMVIQNQKDEKLKSLTDDEIGFILIYFQNSIEKLDKQLNVLIVCTTGIGTSHLLETRIKKYFPTLNIVDVISVEEVNRYNTQKIDLILTTVNISKVDIPQIIVSALLDKGDINLINEFIVNNPRRHK